MVIFQMSLFTVLFGLANVHKLINFIFMNYFILSPKDWGFWVTFAVWILRYVTILNIDKPPKEDTSNVKMA